jgi:hypothetical protein
MRGEVEFRDAIAIPLAVTVIVVAFGLDLAWWETAICCLAGLGASVALMADAYRRERSRNDLIVELLAANKASSPLMDRLMAEAKNIAPSPIPIPEQAGDPVRAGGTPTSG